MVSIRVAFMVFLVIIIAGATLWMAWMVRGIGMPGWGMALGPILLALTLLVHFKGRK